MDPQNLESAAVSVALTPDQEYTFKWDMQPHDYVFQPGHRIGIVLSQSDWGQYQNTIRPAPGTKLTVLPSLSEVTLPIVGNGDALRVNASSMKSLVKHLEAEGEFTNEDTVRSLENHLIAIEQFVKMHQTLNDMQYNF